MLLTSCCLARYTLYSDIDHWMVTRYMEAMGVYRTVIRKPYCCITVSRYCIFVAYGNNIEGYMEAPKSVRFLYLGLLSIALKRVAIYCTLHRYCRQPNCRLLHVSRSPQSRELIATSPWQGGDLPFGQNKTIVPLFFTAHISLLSVYLVSSKAKNIYKRHTGRVYIYYHIWHICSRERRSWV